MESLLWRLSAVHPVYKSNGSHNLANDGGDEIFNRFTREAYQNGLHKSQAQQPMTVRRMRMLMKPEQPRPLPASEASAITLPFQARTSSAFHGVSGCVRRASGRGAANMEANRFKPK
jgi:hypothetical protein